MHILMEPYQLRKKIIPRKLTFSKRQSDPAGIDHEDLAQFG